MNWLIIRKQGYQLNVAWQIHRLAVKVRTKMNETYTVVIERDEDGYYVGSVPALPGCHTQAKSIDQLMERMEEAIALWLEVGKAPTDFLRELYT